jgi:hypothetical protein
VNRGFPFTDRKSTINNHSTYPHYVIGTHVVIAIIGTDSVKSFTCKAQEEKRPGASTLTCGERRLDMHQIGRK